VSILSNSSGYGASATLLNPRAFAVGLSGTALGGDLLIGIELPPIPEPSTLASMVGGLGLAAWRVRERAACA
jgi:hypothetical protein